MVYIKVNPDTCTGCRYCEVACSFAKEKHCRPAVSRIKVHKDEANGVDRPVVCRQCAEPACAAICPVGALVRNSTAGIVEYDRDLCVGCRACVAACPFRAIRYWPEDNKILKCDLCVGDPACVRYCATKTLSLEE